MALPTVPVTLLDTPVQVPVDPIREAKVSGWVSSMRDATAANQAGLERLGQFLEAAGSDPSLGRDVISAMVAGLGTPRTAGTATWRSLGFLLGQSGKNPELHRWLAAHEATLAVAISTAQARYGGATSDARDSAYCGVFCSPLMGAMPHLVDERFLREEIAPLLHSADPNTAYWGEHLLVEACELHPELLEPASSLAIGPNGQIESWKWVRTAAKSMGWKPTREQALCLATEALCATKPSVDLSNAPLAFVDALEILHCVEQGTPGFVADLRLAGPPEKPVTHAMLERVVREAPQEVIQISFVTYADSTGWRAGLLADLVKHDHVLADTLLDAAEKAYAATPDLNRMSGDALASLAILKTQDLAPDQRDRLRALQIKAAVQRQNELVLGQLADPTRRDEMSRLRDELGRSDQPPSEQFSRVRSLVMYRYCQLPRDTHPGLAILLDDGMPKWMPDLAQARPLAKQCLADLATSFDPALGVAGLPLRTRADMHVLAWLADRDAEVRDAARQVVMSWPDPVGQVAAEPVLGEIVAGGYLEQMLDEITQDPSDAGTRVQAYVDLNRKVRVMAPDRSRGEIVGALRTRGFSSPLSKDDAYLKAFEAVARHANDAGTLVSGWAQFHRGLDLLGGEQHLDDAVFLHDHVENSLAAGASEDEAVEAGLASVALRTGGRAAASADPEGTVVVSDDVVTVGGVRIPRRA